MGSYRKGDAEDGATLAASIIRVLAAYPETIVRLVCDPLQGLPMRSKWVPNVYEVGAECERRMKPLRDAEDRRRREKEAELEASTPITPEDVARRKAFIAKWREKQSLLMADVAVANGAALHDLDARKIKGPLKEKVQAASEVHIAKLTEKFHNTPVHASTRLLAIMGLDPFVNARWGGDSRPFIDDTLPI